MTLMVIARLDRLGMRVGREQLVGARLAVMLAGLVSGAVIMPVVGDANAARSRATVGRVATHAATSAVTEAREPILATLDGPSGARLFYVDPISLQETGRRSLQLGFFWGDHARSPGGSLLAVSRNDSPALRFVRLPALRPAGGMTFHSGLSVSLIAWPAPRLLYALLDASPSEILAIDPIARRVLWRRALAGSMLDVQPAAGGVVVLGAPADRIGAATIAFVNARGSLRSVTLTGIQAGVRRNPGARDYAATVRSPGLAVAAGGAGAGGAVWTGGTGAAGNGGGAVNGSAGDARAYVVGAGEPVAQVDLASMRVSYHGGSATAAKAVSGPMRQAIWLGGGELAVTGSDLRTATDGQGNATVSATASGLALIDTRTWVSRRLLRGAAAEISAGGSLLAFGSEAGQESPARRRAGTGVWIYRREGARVRHVLGRAAVIWAQAQGGLAYLWLVNANGANDRVAVVDAATGHVLARETRSLVLLATT